jgi:hypothetical protein
MTLKAWQEQLQNHFDGLRRLRSASAGDKPIFALEHGLEVADREALAADIKAHIAEAAPSKDHALPWIVYATEIGYRYAGDEYWQTFAEETPRWTIHGDRDWLRERFRAFHKQFGGAKPSGPWANHFSIICWPITHAILPRDLQRQLAEILYYMRDLFSAELLTSPMAFGEQIAALSWNASSRFQKLVEGGLLIGQIATALLLQGTQGSEGLILPATLRRIGADLDRARTARDWLRSAQHVAQRIQLHGLSSVGAPAAQLGRYTPADLAREQVTALAIEPRLVLRPTGEDSWDVLLELPDFSNLLATFPGLRSVLTGSRCEVTGSSSRPLARGALLHGPQQVTLRTWPGASDVLLRFEQPTPTEFEYLLRTECLLRSGPRWLFRVASDGLAYELRCNVVRPGHTYILANSGGPWRMGPSVKPIRLACEGIHGARLDVPAAVSGEWAELLEDLGLNQAGSIDVQPVGLAAANWDGQGRAEWLTYERPCIRIRPDHALDAVTVTLDSPEVQPLELSFPTPGLPVFIELPPLSVGVHTVRVSARAAGITAQEHAGELVILIRKPRTWTPGMSTTGALRISIDPPVPTLEQMWEGRVAVDIRGPAGRHIIPTISLFERHANEASVRKRLPPLPIPADAEAWRSHFEQHFRDVKDIQRLYDPAHTCRIELSAEELGGFSLTCEREFSPLRWVVRRPGPEYELSLLDDTGSPRPPDVSRYEFIDPDRSVRLDSAQFSPGYSVPTAGGLYRACAADLERSVILPPAARSFRLQELVVEPEVQRRQPSVGAVEELLSLIQMWFGARLTGLFSATKRRSVLVALLQEVFAIIGGQNWAIAERNLRSQDTAAALDTLKRAVSDKPSGISLAAKLLLDCAAYITLGKSDRVDGFASTARRLLQFRAQAPVVVASVGGVTVPRRTYGPEHPNWIFEFALRLASSPETLHSWADDDLGQGLQWLLNLPILARAARFLVLAVDRHSQASAASDWRLYRAWGWE